MGGGTLYDSGMGPIGPNGIQGGSLWFKPDGTTHTHVYFNNPGLSPGGDRMSWSEGPKGVFGEHIRFDGRHFKL
jgi:hypothetical protein